MDIDLELYRHEVRVSTQPLVRLSAIDINPELARRTLVFLHGYGGQALQWRYQLQDFGLNNRVIALDLRGHGRSDAPDSDYTMAEIQADLTAALDLLEVKGPVVLVGHSFGGAVASQFAHEHPDRVDRLILLATAGEFHLNATYRFLLKLPYTVHRLMRPFVRNWLAAPPTVMKRLYYNTLLKWNGWSLFRDLTVPTLIIRGHRDRVFAKSYFEEVARAIPGAEEANVGASGHMVMLERRDAVNRAIKDFLSTAKTTWRERGTEADASPRIQLARERPWLHHYEDGVPYTIAVPNIPIHHLLRSIVRRFPLRAATAYFGARMTYRRLNHEANRFANALHALGIEKGDRVMILMPNVPQLVICFYGAMKAGVVAVFTLPLQEPGELVRQVRDSDARLIVTLPRFEEMARRALDETQLEHVIFTSEFDYLPPFKRWAASRGNKMPSLKGQKGIYQFSQILYRHSRKNPDLHVSPDDLAVIQYTGGTTAQPKGVMLTHRNLVANTLQTRHWMPEAQEGKEVFLCVVPFSHSYGLTAALNAGISVGATLVLLPRFEVEQTLEAIRKYRPTIFPGVPLMYVAISNFPGVRKYGVSSIRACISGAAPLPVEVQETFEKLTRGRLVEGYGLTEAGPATHANPLNGKRKVGTIGIPMPSTEARVVSLANSKKDVPAGQIGELAVRGPQIMRGYWGNEKATHEVITPDGWLLTGDVAQMDEEGYFRIVARKAEMWYPSKPDQPAFPRDVEEALFEVPQVKEAAVVAIAGQPIAFVIAQKDKPTAESLIAYCKRRLPPELVPRLVIFVEDFPRSFIGKVLRRELTKYYEQHHAA